MFQAMMPVQRDLTSRYLRTIISISFRRTDYNGANQSTETAFLAETELLAAVHKEFEMARKIQLRVRYFLQQMHLIKKNIFYLFN